MKKNGILFLLLLCVALSACSGQEENGEPQMQSREEDSTEAKEHGESASEAVRPAKEEVLAAREQVLAGMSEEEAEWLTENVRAAHMQMESAYVFDNLFEKLEDPENLHWNYF